MLEINRAHPPISISNTPLLVSKAANQEDVHRVSLSGAIIRIAFRLYKSLCVPNC